jgi:hypothetical protein
VSQGSPVDGKRLKRLLLAVAGAFGAAVALFALLLAVNQGLGFGGCTGTGPLGWSLPLVSGLLIGGVAWGLLFTAPNRSDEKGARHCVPCPSCDKAVMEDWRMCPYCGRILPVERPAQQH